MVHSTAIIGEGVRIHASVVIEPYVVITGPCTIGEGTYVGAHTVIGAPSQHHGHYPSPLDASDAACGVVIGAGVTLREFVTVHQGLFRATTIRAGALIMASSHVAHDCVVGEGVTAAPFMGLGGFTTIGDDAMLGQGVVTHPWIVIGEGAMIGLNSSVIRDVGAFTKVAGAPARLLGENTMRVEGRASDWVARDEALRVERDELVSAWRGVAC